MYKILLKAVLIIMGVNAVAQNVGIGTANPTAPLTFGNTYGNKIVFWGNALTPHYGIGIQPGQMQVYTNLPVDNIGFGIGSSGAFGENLRITGNGRVGIRVQNPTQILDVGGRIQLTAFDTAIYYDPYQYEPYIKRTPAYMFFANSNNTAVKAKLGPSDSLWEGVSAIATFYGFHDYATKILRLGLLSNAAGQGRLAVNGNIGESGQVLRTKGANGGAWWSNTIGSDIYRNSAVAYGSSITLTSTLKLFAFRKSDNDYLNNSYDLKSSSRLLVRFRVSARGLQCNLCGPSVFDLVLTDNGNIVRTFRYTVLNGADDVDKMGSALLTLPAGLHQLGMGGYMVSGPPVDIGSRISLPPSNNQTDGSRMVVQVITSFN